VLLSESIVVRVGAGVLRRTLSTLACIFFTPSNQASSTAVIGPGPVLVGDGVAVGFAAVGFVVVGCGDVTPAAGLLAPPPQPVTSSVTATAANA